MSHAPGGGLSRRSFLLLVGLGGSASLAAACVPTATPSPTAVPARPTTAPAAPAAASPAASPAAAAKPAASPSPAATAVPSPVAKPAASPVPSPAASPAAAPSPTSPPISKPLPAAAFIPFGTNAEMRFEALNPTQLTMPQANHFVRSHAASPRIDAASWRLSVEGSGVERPLTLTYDELQRLPSKTLVRSLECTGNGRSFYQLLLNRPAMGTQWKLGAYAVAEWTGVPLSELLQRAGVKRSATEVMAVGLDQPRVRRPLPMDKAMQDDTLLVWRVNGEPLLQDHGFPARLIVPGWGGISSIKWVGQILVTEEPNFVDWNTRTYVFVGPDYQPEPPRLGPPVNEQVMKTAIAAPWPGELRAGQQTVRGYAWSPRGKITRVDVSIDGGSTFQPARLIEPNVERGGVRWEYTFEARPGEMTITARSADDQGQVQPVDLTQQKWNEQGYVFGTAVPHPFRVVA